MVLLSLVQKKPRNDIEVVSWSIVMCKLITNNLSTYLPTHRPVSPTEDPLTHDRVETRSPTLYRKCYRRCDDSFSRLRTSRRFRRTYSRSVRTSPWRSTWVDLFVNSWKTACVDPLDPTTSSTRSSPFCRGVRWRSDQAWSGNAMTPSADQTLRSPS